MNRGWGISPEFRKAEMNERLLWKWVKVAWLLWESCQISNLLLEVISERWDFAKQSFMKAKTRQQNNFEIPSISLLHSVRKSQKKSHSLLRAKRATYTFWVDKSSLKCQKLSILASFWKTTKACGQTVLPDRTIIIGQKLVEN